MENTRKFRIFGMDCAEEVILLKREVGPVVGGEQNLSFDILAGKMTVSKDSNATADEIVDSVKKAGLRAEPWSDDRSQDESRESRFAWLRSTLVITSAIGTVAGFLSHAMLTNDFLGALGHEGASVAKESPPVVSLVLYGAAILAGVWMVLPKAYLALRRLRPDINLLMVVAVTGAVSIGEWFEAATVACLFAFSALLESWSIHRARKAIASLLDLAPPTVRVLTGGDEKEVQLSEVQVGSTFLVRPGERIALDGQVTRGSTDVNQAPITGESKLVEKNVGDQVFAGTINGDGAIEVKSTVAAGDTTLARIVQMVEDAQSRRAPSEQWVESFARVYTPAVMVLAVLVLVIPPLLFSRPWTVAIYDALILLVIACPCALVISTPVSIVAGLTAAARRGVLVKGGMYLEIPSRIKAIAFDKTGTLTRGKPEVVEVVPLSGHTEDELLERALAIEAGSDHPLARAIVEHAKGRGVKELAAEGLKTLQGKGVVATVDGRSFWLGSHRYLEERKQETPEVHEKLEALSKDGRTVVVIGNDKHVCGFLGLADTTRPEAVDALSALKALEIEHLVMLTGDNRPTAEAIARSVGLTEVESELLPGDKVKAVEKLVEKYGAVAMLGDGINDAPALARASIGIAMGAVGSDAALETADIVLMSDDLSQLPWLVGHSRRTLAIIRQNITMSLAIKAVFLALIFFGWASLWAAIAADMGTSLIVISNSLRLLRSDAKAAPKEGSDVTSSRT